MNINYKISFVFLLLIFIVGCARPQGNTAQQKRDYVLRMKTDALTRLYREMPGTRSIVENAPGYAVFSNIGTGFLILGSGQGYGVVIDNATGNKTYIRMAGLGVGLGIQIKDYREVMVFNNKRALYDFIEKGWDFGGEATAGAKTEKKGGYYTASESFEKGVKIYQITDKGVSLRASVSGSKYWRDGELN